MSPLPMDPKPILITIKTSASESSTPNEKRSLDLSATLSLSDTLSIDVVCPSTLRLFGAHIGAALTLFLATTDANIISTSLPTISRDLDASQSQYTWVGVAYLLTQTAFQPLYGRMSDIVGRKAVLMTSIVIFALGSLLCGVSSSIVMLIMSRALAGIGGGGIVSSVWVLTAEIVPVQSRTKWSQALSITWGCSAVAGPLLGGAFSGNTGTSLSWRWGFFINLPICLIASVILVFSLRGVHLSHSVDTTFQTILKRFDFGGLIFFMVGTCLIVWGLSFANQNGWDSALTIGPLVIGLFSLLCGSIYELHTKRDCIFPPSVFKSPTTIILLVITFLHNLSFMSGMFYLALYFQTVTGDTPFQAGLHLLPFSLGSSLVSLPVAWFIEVYQRTHLNTSGQNRLNSVGLLISTIGYGLFILLDKDSSMAMQVGFPLVAGVGLGVLFYSPYQVYTRSLKPQELAAGTSAFFLTRFTGATVGLAVSGAIAFARASRLLPPGFDLTAVGGSAVENSIFIDAVATCIQTIWIVCTSCLGISFLLSFMVETFPLEREEVDKNEVSE